MMLTMGERQHHVTELTWRDFFLLGEKKGERGRGEKAGGKILPFKGRGRAHVHRDYTAG